MFIAKARELRTGLDPDLVSIAFKIRYHHVKAGSRRFRQLLEMMGNRLDLAFEEVQLYVRDAYNQICDDREFSGGNVADLAAEVVGVVRAMREEIAAGAHPPPRPSTQRQLTLARTPRPRYRPLRKMRQEAVVTRDQIKVMIHEAWMDQSPAQVRSMDPTFLANEADGLAGLALSEMAAMRHLSQDEAWSEVAPMILGPIPMPSEPLDG